MYCIPPWVPTLELCLSQASTPHTFTLSTISKNGFPRARTCVFRSWLFNDKSTGVILFTTDLRSQKIQDLQSNDGKFEACFYFPNNTIIIPENYSYSSNSPQQSTTNNNINNNSTHHHDSHSSIQRKQYHNTNYRSHNGSISTSKSGSIQIRLSGFAQILMPSKNFYPSMNPTQISPFSLSNGSSSTSATAVTSKSSLNSSNSSNPYHNQNSSTAPTPPMEPSGSPILGHLKNNQSSHREEQDDDEDEEEINNDDISSQSYPIYSPRYLKHYKEQFNHEYTNCLQNSSNPTTHQSNGNYIPSNKSSSPSSSTSIQNNNNNKSIQINNDEDDNIPSSPPPPSKSEWNEEYKRIWKSLSIFGKTSFKRPEPGTLLDDDKRRRLDKLSRGVDGSSDDAGIDNFVVIAMFVNDADVFYDLSNRRCKAKRLSDDDWIEEDVCP